MSAAIERYPFIFSNKRKFRLKRHVAFWGAWWIFQAFLYSFSALVRQESYLPRLASAAADSLVYLLAHMFLAYSLMYFVLPRFVFKGKYALAAAWVLVCFALTAIISSVLSLTVINYIKEAIFGYSVIKHNMPEIADSKLILAGISLSLLAGLRGGITIGGMAAAIKLTKYWYQKEQLNLQLQHEKSEAQLKLLKSQIHPHFFFNTLNNIYSFTQTTSKPASELVLGLSNILRYMLYETNQSLVPLQNELRMIEQYINLEAVRYGNKLDTHVSMKGQAEKFLIAPLLLIPFIENCYKHGCSEMIENPWLYLDIVIEEEGILRIKLLNSKPVKRNRSNPGGIGISNVIKRLALLYPHKHQLEIIHDEKEVFIVNLSLHLERRKEGLPQKIKSIPSYELA